MFFSPESYAEENAESYAGNKSRKRPKSLESLKNLKDLKKAGINVKLNLPKEANQKAKNGKKYNNLGDSQEIQISREFQNQAIFRNSILDKEVQDINLIDLEIELILAELPFGTEILSEKGDFKPAAKQRLKNLLKIFAQIRETNGTVILFCDRSLELQLRFLGDSYFGSVNFMDGMIWRHRCPNPTALRNSSEKSLISSNASRGKRTSDAVLYWCFDRNLRDEFQQTLNYSEFFSTYDSADTFFQNIIENLSSSRGRVLVPFADSVSACVAASRCGRGWTGFCKKPNPEMKAEFSDSEVDYRIL